MTEEQIIKILTKYDNTNQSLVREIHKQWTMIDPMDYHKIATEIHAKQEEEKGQLLINFINWMRKFDQDAFEISNKELVDRFKQQEGI